jgi:hypothetical protein
MLSKQKSLAILLIFFSLINFTILAQNNTTSLKQMSTEADLILAGKVVSQNSNWNKENTRIYTSVTIEVDELIKGSSTENKITVVHPGGEVGEIGELYSHTPKFVKNEEVLLFTKKDINGRNYKVLKGEEGKLTIFTDQKSGEKVTSSNKKVSALKTKIKNYVKKQ